MVDFRKAAWLLVILVALTSVAGAQVIYPALSCIANGAQPMVARAEGVAEEVGQVEIRCTGGTPTGAGKTLGTLNVQIFLSTEVTSKIINTSNSSTEAELVVDNPPPGAATRRVVEYPYGSYTAVDNIGRNTYVQNDPLLPAPSAPNVYVSQTVAGNTRSLVWLGVPFDAPGTGERFLRIVNVRANAANVGVGSGFIPNQINMFITISGTGGPTLSNPLQVVASVLRGMTYSTTSISPLACESKSLGQAVFTAKFAENFGTAFKTIGGLQPVLGTLYNTESMWTNDSSTATGSSTSLAAGYATTATRLIMKLSGIPAGVSVYVTDQNAGATIGWAAQLVSSPNTDGSGGTVTSTSGWTKLTIASDGSAVAVWEVTGADPSVIASYSMGVSLVYTAAGSSPGLGTISSVGSYAPINTTAYSVPVSTAGVPRFVNSAYAGTPSSIVACQTNLLFPYIVSLGVPGVQQWDTGIAISNTSKDPFTDSAGNATTYPQSGTCKLYFYGEVAGGGAAPPVQETSVIAPGKVFGFTLWNGSIDKSVAPVQQFAGYLIARCSFQYGHGFAFISDLAASKLAEGYLALVMDEKLGTRTGTKSESLDN